MPQIVLFPTQGRRSLKAWLSKTKTTQAAFAKLVRVCQQTVSDWRRGKVRPEAFQRVAIEQATGIPRDAWLLPEERRRLRAAKAA